MRTFRFDKLVRDKIAQSMEAEGSIVKWHKLDDEEYAEELVKKLEEELDELDEGAGKDRDRDLKELADVAEVYEAAWENIDRDEYYELFEDAADEIEATMDAWEFDAEELLAAKAAKNAKFGAFLDRIYIETVSVEDNNPWIKTYTENPEKYPEVL